MSPDRVLVPAGGEAGFGPWNPGIESALPRAFLPLATIYRPENVATPLGEALELGAFCGLPPQELVAFRPERLVVHAVLIRVMADLSVPMGETYGDLGVNFRAIVATILREMEPHRGTVLATYDEACAAGGARIEALLGAIFDAPAPPPAPRAGGWRRVLGLSGSAPPAPPPEPPGVRAERVLAPAVGAADPLERAAARALQRVVVAVTRQRGGLIRDRALLARLALTLFSNDYGARHLGRLIEPWFARTVQDHGYHRLVAQAQPIVMNVKGASASGKSTMRPLQRALAEEIGVAWSDFAVITPDIWRKYLLDYDALGPARRYAGTLTGHELEIVDRKLDLYMARKAREGRMSHLLIDRFRFDSFNATSGAEDGSQLLTRFGHLVYMLFMVTPPDATVERAWKRGEQFGRYKAVDDLLAHNVEAYTGMPRLFFTWALKGEKRVHYEFLDNSVPLGARPRTIAFGWNGAMTILDPKGLIDVDRYRKVDVEAHDPAAVYPGTAAMAPEANTGFLRQCARMMTSLRFAEHGTGRVYARWEKGRLACLDGPAFARALADPEHAAALKALADPLPQPGDEAGETLSRDRTRTLGAWG